MKRNMPQVLVITAALIAGPLVVSAWTTAPASPPNSNVSAPLNVGSSAQSKVAGLLLNTGDNAAGLTVYSSSASTGKVGIGNIGTPSYKLQVGLAGDGSAVGSNAFFYMSDARLKSNVSPLASSLDKILKLQGVSFTWKSTGSRDIGFVAQDVEKIFPEVVNTGNDGIKAVEYGHLIAPLVEAVKAQQNEIESLKARIQVLEAGFK